MKNDKIIDECLKEMFRRVGEKYPNKELTDKKEWYLLRSWTQKEEDSYRKWLKKKLKKAIPYLTEKKLDYEVAMFLLMWSWKYEEEK